LGEPADFRKIGRNRSDTEASEQIIFVHGDVAAPIGQFATRCDPSLRLVRG
jgi:hypothetical protein